MTWDQVLSRDDIVGGDIEVQEGNTVTRGPILDIRRVGTNVVFETEWLAQMPNPNTGRTGPWKIADGLSKTISYNGEHVAPQSIGGRRILLKLDPGNLATIFPVGSSKLNPLLVRGFGLTIEFRVAHIIAEVIGCEVDQIRLQSHIRDDLGADSLNAVDLMMHLEEEFDIEIPDDLGEVVARSTAHSERSANPADHLTVQHIVDYIAAKQKAA